MPRYLVECHLGTRGSFPPPDVPGLIERNLMRSVTWICSFVADGRTFGFYEGPHPEAVRGAARASGLDVERISEVRVFDPYAFWGAPSGPNEDRRTDE